MMRLMRPVVRADLVAQPHNHWRGYCHVIFLERRLRMHKKLHQVLAVGCMVSFLAASVVPSVYAVEIDTSIGEDNSNISDGQNGSNITGDTSIDRNESSESTPGSSSGSTNNHHASRAEIQANNSKNDIRDTLLQWIENIKNNENFGSTGMAGNSESEFAVGITQIPASQLQALLEKVQIFKQNITLEDGLNETFNKFNEVKNTEWPHATISSASGDWDGLTEREKTNIKRAINEKEELPADRGNHRFTLSEIGCGNHLIQLNYNPSRIPGFSVRPILPNGGSHTGIRPDIIIGGFKDFDSYAERYDVYANSAAMEDYLVVGYIEDYHISNVQKDHVEIIDYTSDRRRWNIIDLETGESVQTMITDNPRHELITNFDREGRYKVVAEQEARYKIGTYVTYDKCEYLFDVSNKNLLYFNEEFTSDGGDNGGSILVDGEEREGWVPTGDEFVYNVNDLGEVEIDGNAVQRTE